MINPVKSDNEPERLPEVNTQISDKTKETLEAAQSLAKTTDKIRAVNQELKKEGLLPAKPEEKGKLSLEQLPQAQVVDTSPTVKIVL